MHAVTTGHARPAHFQMERLTVMPAIGCQVQALMLKVTKPLHSDVVATSAGNRRIPMARNTLGTCLLCIRTVKIRMIWSMYV